MKNILIVGGAGYVGGAVTDILLKNNYNIKVYDNLLYEDSYRKEVDFIFGDVRERDKLLKLLKWADIVIWLAAIVGDGACQLNPELTVEVNEKSVEWLAKNFDGRIIFTSTCSVYGAQDAELDENSPVNPLSLYAASKLRAEKHLLGKNAVIFRLGTLFGVGDLFSRIRLDLIVNILTVRASKYGRINVFGGEQFRPLLHVKDVALAALKCLDGDFVGIFNIHKQNVRIIDLAYQLRNHYSDLIIEITDMPFQDTRNYRVSSELAKKTFGFNPVYTIDDGIEEIKYLIENNRIKDINNIRYSNVEHLKNIWS